MVCDCQVDAKLFDLSFVSSSSSSSGHIESLPLLKSWEPHPGGTTTDLIALDALGCFAASSDTGDITIWDGESGEARGKFAQRKTWPVADPRASSHRDRSAQPPQGDRGAGERRGHSSGSDDDDDSDDSDDSGSDGSDSDSDEDADAKPGMSRRASVLSSDSSRSRSLRESKKGPHRKGSRKAKGKGKVGASAAPPRKEPSYAETHPMYVPRDDCDRYLQEHAQQMHMEAAAAAAAARAAAREKEEHGSRRAGGAAGGHGSKSHLADMLNKLEADLRHQHAHEQQRERGAAAGAGSSGFGSGTGSGSGSGAGAGPDSKHNVHSNAHSYARERERDRDRDRDRSHGGHHAHGAGVGMGDASAAVQGAHVYERFHTHHATGTSLSNNGSSSGVNFAASSSSSSFSSHANATDSAGESFSTGGSATHRSSRVRHLTVEEEPNSASGSSSSFSASGSRRHGRRIGPRRDALTRQPACAPPSPPAAAPSATRTLSRSL
jgi:hypothetical protein